MLAYLKDGALDILGLQYYLTNGFEFPEAVFHPEAYIISIKEPEVGCEGREDGEKAYAVVQVFSNQGIGCFCMEDRVIYTNHLFEDVWIGTKIESDGTKEFGCFCQKQKSFRALEQWIWDRRIEQK